MVSMVYFLEGMTNFQLGNNNAQFFFFFNNNNKIAINQIPNKKN